jgi:hypothetical protein
LAKAKADLRFGLHQQAAVEGEQGNVDRGEVVGTGGGDQVDKEPARHRGFACAEVGEVAIGGRETETDGEERREWLKECVKEPANQGEREELDGEDGQRPAKSLTPRAVQDQPRHREGENNSERILQRHPRLARDDRLGGGNLREHVFDRQQRQLGRHAARLIHHLARPDVDAIQLETHDTDPLR